MRQRLREQIDDTESFIFYSGGLDNQEEINEEKEQAFEKLKYISSNYLMLDSKIQEHKVPVLLLEGKAKRLQELIIILKSRGVYKLKNNTAYIEKYRTEVDKIKEELEEFYYKDLFEVELYDL